MWCSCWVPFFPLKNGEIFPQNLEVILRYLSGGLGHDDAVIHPISLGVLVVFVVLVTPPCPCRVVVVFVGAFRGLEQIVVQIFLLSVLFLDCCVVMFDPVFPVHLVLGSFLVLG